MKNILFKRKLRNKSEWQLIPRLNNGEDQNTEDVQNNKLIINNDMNNDGFTKGYLTRRHKKLYQ